MATAIELVEELSGFQRDQRSASASIEATLHKMQFSVYGSEVARVTNSGNLELKEARMTADHAAKLRAKLDEWFPDPTPTPSPDHRRSE